MASSRVSKSTYVARQIGSSPVTSRCSFSLLMIARQRASVSSLALLTPTSRRRIELSHGLQPIRLERCIAGGRSSALTNERTTHEHRAHLRVRLARLIRTREGPAPVRLSDSFP